MDTVLRQITKRVRDAAAQRQPLRIAGSGSKNFHPDSRAGAPVPALDMRPYAGVLSYEPSELVITVRAGTPLAEVEALLAAHGQCLAFEPPRFGAGVAAAGDEAGGTVGGMVAAGLSGPARASVGAVRDFVLGAEIVNGRGELLRFGGQVMKNVAGYDISRLMAGSWGRLAAITEVSLKVLPVAPAEATLHFADCSQHDALARLHAWGGQPLPLNASCWLEEGGIGQLYVRLRGARAAIEAACRRMGGQRLAESGAAGAGSPAADWQACRDQRLPWFAAREPALALWRLSLPQTAPVLELPAGVGAPLIEWQGGLRWVQAAPQHGAQLARLAREVGGSASLFIADSDCPERVSGHFDLKDAALQAIHQRLYAAFDPAGVFGFAAAA